MVQLLCL